MTPALYQALFGRSPIETVVWAVSGDPGDAQVIAANAASATEYSTRWGRPLSMNAPARDAWPELLASDGDTPSFIAQLQQVAQTGDDLHLLVPYAPAGRPQRLYRCDIYGVGPGRVAVSYTDVTAEQRRQFELQWFASAASHDLLSPLRTVSAWLDRLHGRYLGTQAAPWDARADRWLGFVLDGVARMEGTTAGLLEYVRGPGPDEAPVRTELTTALAEAVEDLEIEEAVRVETALPAVRGRRAPLVLIFRNLLQNAAKYRQPDRPLQIWIRSVCLRATGQGCPAEAYCAPKGYVCLAVTDNGRGVADDYLEAVFEPLKRLWRHDQIPGSGLGLSTCRRIVERHEGRIWMESAGEGHGATVYLTLPLWPEGDDA